MDAKVKSVLNYVRGELTEREQRALLNQLAFGFGIRLHARESHARPAECDIPVVVGGDYNNTSDQNTEQNTVSNSGYKQKVLLLDKIIKKDTWATKGRDFGALSTEVKVLLNTLTLPELEKLDGEALLTMCRIVMQSRDPGVTNRTAYILGAYSNLINGVEYQKRWRLKYKLDHGEITEEEFMARLKVKGVN